MHTNYFTYAIPQNAGPSQIMQIPAPAITSRAINQPSQHNYPTATANVVTVNTTKYVQQAQILTQPSSSSSSKPSNTSSAHGSNESQTVCTICHQSFKKSSSLLKHMRVHRTKNETEPAKPAASSFVCNVCKIDYVNAATFEYHIRTQHNTPQLMSCIECGCVGVMSAGTTASYRCDDCSSKSMKVEYASSNSPEYHVKPRTRSKSSKHAIKSIGDADMNQLVEIMRSGDANGRRRKSHECTWCGRTYKHQSTLAMHLKTHTGEYKYKCEYCDKEFMLAEYYNRHLRVHTKEKPYQCDVCDKSFSQSNTLIQHKRIHTGEKPYECTICGKAFSVRDYLLKHIRVHTGEKPFECDICGKKYTQRSGLNSHQKLHFAEESASNGSQTQDLQDHLHKASMHLM